MDNNNNNNNFIIKEYLIYKFILKIYKTFNFNFYININNIFFKEHYIFKNIYRILYIYILYFKIYNLF